MPQALFMGRRRAASSLLCTALAALLGCGDDPREGARPDAGAEGGAVPQCHDESASLPPAPADACLGGRDAALVDPASAEARFGADVGGYAFLFARGCTLDGAGDVRRCAVAELRNATACEPSIPCATCYADYGRCVNARCAAECLRPECTLGPSASDPEQWVVERCPDLDGECDACRCAADGDAPSCLHALEACAGLELEAVTEACGRGGLGGG